MWRALLAIGALAVLASVLSGCGPGAAPAQAGTPLPRTDVMPLQATAQLFGLTSSAFQANALIPERYSCHGANVSPPLAWSAPPVGTQSLVLVVDDPDAVKVVGSIWDHWLLFNLPADTLSMPEGVRPSAELPSGGRQGQNSGGGLGYSGPCPPSGQNHGYRFTIYAVDTVLPLKSGAVKAAILKAIAGHTLAQSELVGRYASP